MPTFLQSQFAAQQAKQKQPNQAFGTGAGAFANPALSGSASGGQAFPAFGGASGNPFALFQQIASNPMQGSGANKPPLPGIAGAGTMSSEAIRAQLAHYNQMNLQQRGGPNMMQQFLAALGQDTQQGNLSQQMQFQGGQNLMGQNNALMAGMQQNLVNPAMANAQAVQQMGQGMQQLGNDQVAQWRELYDRNRGDLQDSLGEANDLANQGVQDFVDAKAGYKDMAAQNVSAMIGGMGQDLNNRQRDLQNQMMQAEATGDQMGVAMAQQGLQSLKSEWGAQRQQLATQMLNEQNQTMARLTQDIGQARMSSAGLHSSNAAQMAGFDSAGQGQLLQAHGQQMQAHQLAADLATWSTNFQAQVQMAAIDKQMNGMQFSAQMLQQFPWSPVSMVDVMLSAAMASEAGMNKKTGFKFPKQNFGGPSMNMPFQQQ